MSDKARQLRVKQYSVFKAQDAQKGHFDVTFQIGSQQLHAHKFMLSSVSDTFETMFEERWTKKDEPFPITAHSYDDFKEFLNFIYVSECAITDKNISSIVDLAEFYHVPELMDICDEYLTKMTIDIVNFFPLFDFSTKYPNLVLFKPKINGFMKDNLTILLKSEGYLTFKQDLVKEIVNTGLSLDKYEDVFEGVSCLTYVYNWAENQAVIKQENNESLNKNEIIKEEINHVLPKIDFKKMSKDFVHRYLIPRALIFTTEELQELSDRLCTKPCVSVAIISQEGKTLRGNVYGNISFLEPLYKIITCLKMNGARSEGKYASWYKQIMRPFEPSLLTKNNMFEYYFILFKDNNYLGIRQTNDINAEDYLLAELKSDDGFILLTNEINLKIEASSDF